MASEEEKQIVVGLEGDFHAIEWPWNKPEIVVMRHQARELVHSLGNEEEDFITSMTVFQELIQTELRMNHESIDHYDEQDGGKLSAILLNVDNFVQNQTEFSAIAIHNLIMSLENEIYVPGAQDPKFVDLESNIVNDIWFIMSFLEDWCLVTDHQNWLLPSEGSESSSDGDEDEGNENGEE
jgi:hypothetical protein